MKKNEYELEIIGVSEIIYELSEISGRDLYEVFGDIKQRLEELQQRDSDKDYILGICEECDKFKKCIYKGNEGKCSYILKTIDEYKS
jgi:hypothetical protein